MPEEQVPWNDGEFDEEKAKSLILSLRSDKEKLQGRLKTAMDGKKDVSARERDLQQENTRLKVQMKTGLSDQQIKRLVGETEDELLEDASLFAEETGIELTDFTASAGTPDTGSGDGEDEGEQGKQFSTNYRTPQNQSMADHEQVDMAQLVESLDIG